VPESAPPITSVISTQVLATALAPTAMVATEIVKPLRLDARLNLSALRNLTVITQVTNAPLLQGQPAAVDQAVVGADGSTYYVPRARVATRSKATNAPYVFMERRDGAVRLQVWFELSVPAGVSGAEALPVDGFSVALVGSDGVHIAFGRVDELPPTDKPEGVISQLYCEAELTAEQVGQATTIMQTQATAAFRVEGNVHYSLPDGGSSGTWQTPGRVVRDHRIRDVIATPVVRDHRRVGRMATMRHGTAAILASVAERIDVIAPVQAGGASTPRVTRMSLGPADNSGLGAHFPTDIPANRPIYAQVTTGFGTEPWAQWVPLQHGRFVESPVPEQFFVLPDEYRLAFDRQSGMPAMMVLLVPPERPAGQESATSFGGDYKIRCRFSVVPWLDPERMELLRQEIADHTGIAYPQLRVGGARSATCALSKAYQNLGSTLVGDGEAQLSVDPHGFDLVLDCTSEFYTLLSKLLLTEGVTGDVVTHLVAAEENPEQATIPIALRLDRPALDFLTAELIPAVLPPPSADPTLVMTEPVPLAPPKLRVSNPIPYPVSVGALRTSLLVVDDTLPTPIGAVAADATPSSFTIAAAAEGVPATVEVELAAQQAGLPALYGGVGVGFLGVDVEIDPDTVLARAHDLGASADLSSTVEVRSYQLEHPDVLPEPLADVFGIEVRLKRGEAEPVTIFLTRDQPTSTVQVSFSLADVIAGARPEQPKFSWQRRNLAGKGTGEWSEWETIIGRQLFVSPTGM
jgi:hypothetical protein